MEKIIVRDKNNIRLFDAVINNDGVIEFEIKDNRGLHKISLQEILNQINNSN